MRAGLVLLALAGLATATGETGPARADDAPLACDGGDAHRVAGDDGAVLRYRPLPDPPPINRPFAIEVLVCADGRPLTGRLSFDARMPAHGHGTNYLPAIRPLGAGRARVGDVLLHMPGHWQAELVLRAPERAVGFRFALTP